MTNPDCTPAFRDLIKVVHKHVITVESCYKKNEYHAEKCLELKKMIETVHRDNEYNLYTNIIITQTAQIYEKSRLQKQVEIRIKQNKLQTNEKRIMELNESTTNESRTQNVIKALKKENEALQKDLEELYGQNYLNKLIQHIIQERILSSKIDDEHTMEYFENFVKAGCFFGTILGAIALPVIGYKPGGKLEVN